MNFLKRSRIKTLATCRGLAMLEVVLASAIIGLVLTGFAVALHKCIDASKTNAEETRLRSALQSRLAEMRAEPVRAGKRIYYYFDREVAVEEEIVPANVQNADGLPLPGMYRSVLLAKSVRGGSQPFQTEALLYLP